MMRNVCPPAVTVLLSASPAKVPVMPVMLIRIVNVSPLVATKLALRRRVGPAVRSALPATLSWS